MTLEPLEAGARLRVVESGFAELPWAEDSRARYAEENAQGWLAELDELRAYVAQVAATNHGR
jgi:hypothetical protein